MLQNKRVSLTQMIFNKRHLHQLNKRSHIDDDIYDRWHHNISNNKNEKNQSPHQNKRSYTNKHNSHLNESFVDLDETITTTRATTTTTTTLTANTNNNDGYFYWLGKDYCNAYREDIKECHIHDKDQFERTEVPRMPWRDQGVAIVGESARDLARHFIQRWNHCKVILKILFIVFLLQFKYLFLIINSIISCEETV